MFINDAIGLAQRMLKYKIRMYVVFFGNVPISYFIFRYIQGVFQNFHYLKRYEMAMLWPLVFNMFKSHLGI